LTDFLLEFFNFDIISKNLFLAEVTIFKLSPHKSKE
jgi:hypothetical protein